MNGLEKGDVVLVHSDITETSPDTLLANLMKSIGYRGAVIVPTFNYSFCKGIPYDHHKTLSQVGLFTNYILASGAPRSFHPIFSFAGLGDVYNILMNNIGKDSFGKDSVFDRLYQANAKILFYQVPFDYCTFVHYAEQAMNVDYRFKKYFSGWVTNEEGKTWYDTFSFFVRYMPTDRYPYIRVETDFSKLDAIVDKTYGDNYFVVSCRDVYDKATELIRQNEHNLVKQSVILGGQTESINIYNKQVRTYKGIKDIVEELFPIDRTLNSDGMDKAFELVSGYFKHGKVYSYPPTYKRMTWRVPERYKVHCAYISKYNHSIKNVLPVSYSTSFMKDVSAKELFPHLHSHPIGIPWIFKYYERDWGFRLPYSKHKAMSADESYFVNIQSEYTNDPLHVYWTTSTHPNNGRRMLIMAHLDHPYQANDGISGVAVGIEVMKRLEQNPLPEGSRRVDLLVTPETIGSVCYFSDEWHRQADGAVFIDFAGSKEDIMLQTSRDGCMDIDDIASRSVSNKTKEYWFRDLYGNDEIISDGVNINIPTVSFGRFPYSEYHTDKDTPDIIYEDKLQEMADVVENTVRIFCTNYIPVANFDGAPFLSGYDMWIDWKKDKDLNHKIESIFLEFDKGRTIFGISRDVSMDYWDVYAIVEKFRERGLVKVKWEK